jgi:hypothetical protein
MNLEDLSKLISDISIGKYGDKLERGAYSVIQKHIPYYEEFWQNIVLPFRGTASDKSPILLSSKLPRSHETVCIYSYSLFRTFIRIYESLKRIELEYELKNDVSTDEFNDCVLYLSIGYNQINLLGLAVFLSFLNKKPSIDFDIVELSRLDTNSKRRPEKQGYYNECKKIFGNKLIAEIVASGDRLNDVRNFIAHGPKFAGYEGKIPKPENVKQLIQWSDFQEYINRDPEDTEGLLIKRNEFVENEVSKFTELINEFWKTLLIELKKVNPEFSKKYISKVFLEKKDSSTAYEEYDKFFQSQYRLPITASGSFDRSMDSDSESGDTITRVGNS